MRTRITLGIAASLLAMTASAHLIAQRRPGAGASRERTWLERTPWGDPDRQGEWTSEGEYGVPFDRPPQFGTRQFLTDEEYAKRLEDVRIRDERDLTRVDYQVTFVDPATWTAPWTAALDLKKRPDAAGVFEYACHEGNCGMSNMLSASRSGERAAGEGR